MHIQDKLKKYAQLEERAEKLRNEIANNKDAKERLEQELSQCHSQRSARDEASKHIRKGIIWLTISVVLIILEVMCLTETLIVGYNDFEIIDLAIILIPLICAIRQFSKGGNLKRFASDEDLAKMISELTEKLSVFKEPKKQLKKIKAEMAAYNGRNWDLSAFRGSPADTAQLEEDLEDLLIALKYNDDKDFALNCWLAKNQIVDSTAIITNDNATKEKYAHVGPTIIATGSWPLLLINACNISMTMEILMLAMHTNGEGIPFCEALERMKMRKPENEDEQALWDLANEVIPDMIAKVVFALKDAMRNT